MVRLSYLLPWHNPKHDEIWSHGWSFSLCQGYNCLIIIIIIIIITIEERVKIISFMCLFRCVHVRPIFIWHVQSFSTGLGSKVGPRFGELCTCSCLLLLPVLACTFHATLHPALIFFWPNPFFLSADVICMLPFFILSATYNTTLVALSLQLKVPT